MKRTGRTTRLVVDEKGLLLKAEKERKKKLSERPIVDLCTVGDNRKWQSSPEVKTLNDALVFYFSAKGFQYDRQISIHWALADVMLAALKGGADIETILAVAYAAAQGIGPSGLLDEDEIETDADGYALLPFRKRVEAGNKKGRQGRKEDERRKIDLTIAVDRLVYCERMSIQKAAAIVAQRDARSGVLPETIERYYYQFRNTIIPAYNAELMAKYAEYVGSHGAASSYTESGVKEIRQFLSVVKKNR